MGLRLNSWNIPDRPMQATTFRVELLHRQNNLNAMVEIISLTGSGAKRIAKTLFFRSSGWEVVSCQESR